jgi:hypothetical protein
MEEKQKYIHAELPIQSTELLLVSTAHLPSRTRDEREDFPPGARTARVSTTSEGSFCILRRKSAMYLEFSDYV